MYFFCCETITEIKKGESNMEISYQVNHIKKLSQACLRLHKIDFTKRLKSEAGDNVLN